MERDGVGAITLNVTTRDIQVLKTYGAAPYAAGLKRLEKQIKEKQASVNEKIGMFDQLLSLWLQYRTNALGRCQGIEACLL